MTNLRMNDAIVNACIQEMKRVLSDPDIDPSDHALDAAGAIGDGPEGSIEAVLEFVPDTGASRPVEQNQWTGEDGVTRGSATLRLHSQTAVQMTLTNYARANLAILDTGGKWQPRPLTGEQQEILDRYATATTFWITAIANGQIACVDEDPEALEEEYRSWARQEILQMEIRKALGEQAFLCLYLARDTSEDDGTPNPAYQDAAAAIRTAAAKIARAHNQSNNARPYHGSKQQETPPEDHHANFQIQLDRPTDPQAVRKALTDAGIGVQDCHPTTQEFEGYVFTQENIAYIWNYQTGYSRCSGECSQDEARHQSWTELHEDQQAAFTQSYQEYIEDQREFEFLPGGPLQNDPKMRTVRMSPHF